MTRTSPRRYTKAFEKNSSSEFEFYLAQKLSMTVSEMRQRMSNMEFEHWQIYYARIAQREEMARLQAKV